MFVPTKKRGEMIDLVVVYQKLTVDGQEGDGFVIVWKERSPVSFEFLAQHVPTSLDQPWTIGVGDDDTIFVSSHHRGLGVVAIRNV